MKFSTDCFPILWSISLHISPLSRGERREAARIKALRTDQSQSPNDTLSLFLDSSIFLSLPFLLLRFLGVLRASAVKYNEGRGSKW
jgi:hypothetical protein